METIKTTEGTRTQFATSMADLGSVVRLNSNNFNASSFSFVLDEGLQLEETPITDPIVHSLASSLFSYSFEVFHNNLISVEIGNNLFADVMINPLRPTVFSSAKLLKKSFSRSSAFTLKFGTQISELPFNLFNLRGIEESIIRSDSEVIYSEINTENSFLQVRAFDINLSGECKKKETSSFSINSQQTFGNVPIEVLFVAIWDCEGNFNSSLDSSKTQDVIFKGSAAREIISHRTIIDDGFIFSLLDHSTRLFNTGNSELCLKSSFTQGFVDKWMELDVIFDFTLPGLINTELQGFFIDSESLDYFGSCWNFDFGCRFYMHNHIKALKYLNIMEDKEAIPLQTKVC